MNLSANESLENDLLTWENITEVLGPKADSCEYFPGKAYDEILACKIRFLSDHPIIDFKPNQWEIYDDGSLSPAFLFPRKRLLPAHEADLNVSLNLQPKHAFLAGKACHSPDFAFLYQSKGKTVALITVSSTCGTVHFEPPSPNRMSLKGFLRLMMVLEELGLEPASERHF